MVSKPLQEPAFLVLSALAAGPLHGYGIAQDVESSSDGRVTLRAGTLYGAIDRLVAAGLVEVDHEEVVDSRLRRYYRLTPRVDRASPPRPSAPRRRPAGRSSVSVPDAARPPRRATAPRPAPRPGVPECRSTAWRCRHEPPRQP